MNTKEAVTYLVEKALRFGYNKYQISPFLYEIQEQVEELDDWDEYTLDELFDKIF